jgi:hypothetical protein
MDPGCQGGAETPPCMQSPSAQFQCLSHLRSSESNLALSVSALMHSSSGSCTTNSSTKLSGMLNSWRREWYLQQQHRDSSNNMSTAAHQQPRMQPANLLAAAAQLAVAPVQAPTASPMGVKRSTASPRGVQSSQQQQPSPMADCAH